MKSHLMIGTIALVIAIKHEAISWSFRHLKKSPKKWSFLGKERIPVNVRRSHYQHVDVIALQRGLAGLGAVQNDLGDAGLLELLVHFLHPVVDCEAEGFDDLLFLAVGLVDAAWVRPAYCTLRFRADT
jgi:hypothetical protein